MSASTGRGDQGAAGSRGPGAWASLRHTLARRKWIVWVIAVVALAAAFQLAVLLLPHSALRSLQSVEDKSNGIQELPQGATTTPSQPRTR